MRPRSLNLIFTLILVACAEAEEPEPAVVDGPPIAPSGVVVRVVDHAEGTPLARADVQLKRGPQRLAAEKTGPDGTFDFGPHPAGEYVVRANYSGGTYVPVAEKFELDGSSGIRIELVLRAFEGQPLVVTVPDGVAMPRVAELTYTKLSSEGEGQPIMTKIPLSDDGTTTMRRLPPARYRLRFRLGGCEPIDLEHEIGYADNPPLRVAFERR